ncbi:MAG: hypothetical protein JNK05_39195 [Myxococcales bacterium]|nr:hypothetical protein [Myxococcales bacterium]
MNHRYLSIAATMLFAACAPAPGPTDSGTDTGVAADVANDQQSPTDSGVGPTDSGVSPTDSGVGPTDSGVGPADSGIGPADSGVGPADSGVAPTDSGIGAGPSYATAVQPILQARCSPCHTGGGSGGWDVSMYATTQLASYYASGRTKGGAFIVRVRDGSMPAGRGCTGNPAMDSANPRCLTAMEQMTLEAWATGGQRP